MQRRLETIEWVCDFCQAREVVHTRDAYRRPEGWGQRVVEGRGYARHMDCCPACQSVGVEANLEHQEAK